MPLGREGSTRLALVPARSGSEGIPLKNIRKLGDRPLIEYVIEAITASETVDRICVSTDDERIAEVARRAGAEVPFTRPAELAGGSVPTIAVIEHALKWFAAHESFEPEHVLMVQPTEPFVRPEHIREALQLMLKRNADSAITVVQLPRTHHPFHVRTRDNEGFVRFEREAEHYASPRRQDDPPRYAFGNLYWFRREAFLTTGQVEAGRCVGVPVDPLSAFDLNTEEDWQIAEILLRGRQGS